jgi:hypothetical protein
MFYMFVKFIIFESKQRFYLEFQWLQPIAGKK